MTRRAPTIVTIALSLLLAGCAAGGQETAERDFTTSGSREADQRAEQRMAQARQVEGAKDDPDETDGKAEEKKPLFERLGGEEGVSLIVDDFVARALADPRVNWERKGVKRGGWSLSRGKSVEWQPTPDNVARLKKHIVQFIAVATGGPSKYEGREMKNVHAGLHITNAEFDATVGCMKASLDKLQVPTD
jgi:hemoglobin